MPPAGSTAWIDPSPVEPRQFRYGDRHWRSCINSQKK
jgi:hypothetical protein